MIQEELFNYLSQLYPLDAEDLVIIKEHFIVQQFGKGDFLAEEGLVCDSILFIQKGFFRVYVEDNIDEKTVHIAGNGDFVSSFASFINRQPSQEFVQAITDVSSMRLTYTKLNELYSTYPKWETLGRRLIEQLFVRKEQRLISLIKMSAEDRYRQLLEKDSELLQHIPLHYIASYLGVRPETLSRIRATIS